MVEPRDEDELYDLYLEAALGGEAEEPDAFCERHGIGVDLRPYVEALHATMSRRRGGEAEGAPAERLGDFRLVRRIGGGGMGAVYLAEQESLGRLVAVKVLRPELQGSPEAAERFRREAMAVARLDDPGIVRVIAVGEEAGTRFLAMELVAGRSLAEWVAEARSERRLLEPARTVGWARDVARALHHAHENGVVHRDVKPSNVRITPAGRALLVDFGIARDERWRGATMTNAFTGSPLYAAPEQLRGGAVDARTDVYALGVTLYECLTGRLPFEGGSVEEVVTRALREEPLPPRRLNPSLARDLELVVLKAIATDPADRYAHAAALADDLDAVLESRPVRARPPGAIRRARAAIRRHPAVAAAAFTVLLGTLTVVLVRSAQRRNDARAVLDDARARLERFRATRASSRDLEAEIARLRRAIDKEYFTEEQDALLAAREFEVEQLRLRREEEFYSVLDLLRRAEQLDPAVVGVEGVRALLFAEKWDEANLRNDPAARAFYEKRARAHDPDGAVLRPHVATSPLRFESEPPGAEFFLYRYRSLHELERGGERRRVPVAYSGEELPVAPGSWVLRVVRGAGNLRPGDLVLSIGGHPLFETLFALEEGAGVRRGDRLVAVDGRPARDFWALREGGQRYRFAAAGEVGAAPRLGHAEQLAAAGAGLSARVYRDDVVEETTLPAGLETRLTGAPFVIHAAARAGVAPCTVDLPDGSFGALFRWPDGTVQRNVVYHRGQYRFRAVRRDWPNGFLGLLCVDNDRPIAVQECEVTAAEYLRFLDDPATRAEIDASPEPIRVPRGGDEQYWERGDDGRYRLTGEWTPEWPVLGVSLEDARAYARWRTAAARAAGRPWRFAVPTYDEWLQAANGASDRQYPWGDVFRPKWTKSCYARPRAVPEPVRRFPRDEAGSGAYDIGGSASEWVDDWYDEPRGLRRLCGGSWANAQPRLFEIWGQGARAGAVSGATGFRLVVHWEEAR